MRNLEETRQYECLVNGEWVAVHWEQLEPGDVVRSCANTVLRGEPTEEFVINELPTLKVDIVKGQCVTKLVDYEFTGSCDIESVAVVHDTTVAFIMRVNPEITAWDRDQLRATIKVPPRPHSS